MPTNDVVSEIYNRIHLADIIAAEVNAMLPPDPVGVIFWWSGPNPLLNDECPKDLLFFPDRHNDLRRAAQNYSISHAIPSYGV